MNSKSTAIIIDVRTKNEYEEERVNGALNIDIYEPNFLSEIQKLDRTKKYLVYCRSGNRSGQAQSIMKQMGFENVENVGGLTEVREKFGTET